MAYQTLVSASRAIMLENKGDSVEGYLLSAKTKVGHYENTIYTLQNLKGEQVQIWGSKTIDSVLLDEKGKALNPGLERVKVRVSCIDARKVKKGKTVKTYRDFKVEADIGDKLNSKVYVLNPAKKFKK